MKSLISSLAAAVVDQDLTAPAPVVEDSARELPQLLADKHTPLLSEEVERYLQVVVVREQQRAVMVEIQNSIQLLLEAEVAVVLDMMRQTITAATDAQPTVTVAEREVVVLPPLLVPVMAQDLTAVRMPLPELPVTEVVAVVRAKSVLMLLSEQVEVVRPVPAVMVQPQPLPVQTFSTLAVVAVAVGTLTVAREVPAAVARELSTMLKVVRDLMVLVAVVVVVVTVLVKPAVVEDRVS